MCTAVFLDCDTVCHGGPALSENCDYCTCQNDSPGEPANNPDGKGEGECCCGAGAEPKTQSSICPSEDGGKCGDCLKCISCK